MTNDHKVNPELWESLTKEEKQYVNKFMDINTSRGVLLKYSKTQRNFVNNFTELVRGGDILKAKATVTHLTETQNDR